MNECYFLDFNDGFLFCFIRSLSLFSPSSLAPWDKSEDSVMEVMEAMVDSAVEVLEVMEVMVDSAVEVSEDTEVMEVLDTEDTDVESEDMVDMEDSTVKLRVTHF